MNNSKGVAEMRKEFEAAYAGFYKVATESGQYAFQRDAGDPEQYWITTVQARWEGYQLAHAGLPLDALKRQVIIMEKLQQTDLITIGDRLQMAYDIASIKAVIGGIEK